MSDSPVVSARVMRPDEWPEARAVCIDAFDDPTIGTLLDLLRESWSWHDDLVFVAEVDGSIAGLVIYSSSFVDMADRVLPVLVLSPLGVRRDLQGRGVGDALMRHSLAEVASTRPEPLVFLEGIPRYYPRFGFELGADLGFSPASPRVPREAFMAYRLPSYDPSMRGPLVYADVFWRADAVGLRG